MALLAILITVISFTIAIVMLDKLLFDHILSTKYSNFIRLDDKYAMVDIEEGFLFFKKRYVKVKIHKEFTIWRRCDNGCYTVGFKVDNLAFAYDNKEK